jgi:hypothetical protein
LNTVYFSAGVLFSECEEYTVASERVERQFDEAGDGECHAETGHDQMLQVLPATVLRT